jgi:putative SOS response-associated peptidase YedK
MPVILARDEWATWTDGDPQAAFALCRPWTGGLQVDRTGDPWTARSGSASAHS